MNQVQQNEAKEQYDRYRNDRAIKLIADALMDIVNHYVPTATFDLTTGAFVVDFNGFTNDPDYIKLFEQLNQYRRGKYPLLTFPNY